MMADTGTGRAAGGLVSAWLGRSYRMSPARVAIRLNHHAVRSVYLFMSRDLPHGRRYSPLHAGLLVPQVMASYLLAASSAAWPVRRFGVTVVVSGGLLLLGGALIGYHSLSLLT